MNSSKLKVAIILTLGAFGIAACGSSGDSGSSPPTIPPITPPPVEPPTSFTQFVKDQFAGTADNTDPVEINDVDFDFDNADNPQAFDDLLQSN